MEIAAGIGGLLGLGVVLWWLLNRPDDPDLDEETAGLIAANWRRIDDHLDGDDG